MSTTATDISSKEMCGQGHSTVVGHRADAGQQRVSDVAKRAFDIAGAALMLVLTLPVLVVTALALRILEGPQVLYHQTRIGHRGRSFRIHKFRTMVRGADEMLIDLAHHNEADGPLFKLRNDPRVTPLGRFLRTSAIDELPQLWNVLRGEMSLVGPRPALPEEVAQYDSNVARRLEVMPGLTGLWQVNGRHELSFSDYVRYDLHYVDNRTLGLDIAILFRTIPALLMRRGEPIATPALELPQEPRVAIVHDFLTQRGGAERVVLSLMRLFPEADLYTSMYDPEGTFPEFKQFEVRASRLQRFMRPGRDARRFLPLYPRIFKKLHLRGYDLVVSSSSGFAHGIKVTGGVHVCYCHNPPRWLYQADDYLAAGSPAPTWALPLIRPLLTLMRRWDRKAATRPDHYIANGSAVAQRVQDTYGRSVSAVVTPPVDVSRVSFGARATAAETPYALVVSRLLPYKRVDLVVEACQQLGLRLVVVGEGPSYEELRNISTETTELRGRVDDAELNGLLHGCVALVQAGTEDFGIAPLEANSAGRPVVAYAAGGALQTVSDGKSGILVHEQTAESFADALVQVQEGAWDADTIAAHADSFGESWFHHELSAVLADCMAATGSRAWFPVREAAPARLALFAEPVAIH